MLGAIEAERGSLDLEPLATAPREEAIEFLERLPGVGRKTAACVLLFSFDRPELPVDTHVYRVASRLGLIRPKAPFEEAHDTLRALADPGDAYELHVNLIRHGRRICTARNPRCRECPLLSLCPYGRERVRDLSEPPEHGLAAGASRAPRGPRSRASATAPLARPLDGAPRHNRANEALCRLLAKDPGCLPRTRVALLKGARSRVDKVVEVGGPRERRDRARRSGMG